MMARRWIKHVGLAVAATLAVLSIAMALQSAEMPRDAAAQTAGAGEASEPPLSSEAGEDRRVYIIKDQGGFVAVFEADASEPVIVSDIKCAALRAVDRNKLSTGITVTGRQDMLKLMEDFSS